jgi:hypothetical protein
MPQQPLARLVGEDKFFGQKLHTSADYITEIRQTDRVHLLAVRIVDRQRQSVAKRQQTLAEYIDRQRIDVYTKTIAIGRKYQQHDNSASTFDSVINGSYYVITNQKHNYTTMNMITPLRTAVVAIVCLVASLSAQAQTITNSLAPREGFWVVESQPKSRNCLVRFYTNDQKLIYEETVHCKLNIARTHTKRQLNVALERAMFVWNATHQIPTDRQWVAVQFEK